MTGAVAELARRVRTPKLRTQLVALLVLLTTIAFASIAVATTLALHGFLLNRLDDELGEAGDRFSVNLEHPRDHDADERQFATVSGQASGTLGARIVDGTVTAAAVVGRPAADPATAPGSPARAALGTLHASPRPATVDLPDLGQYRVLVTPGDDGDLLVTGLPTDPIEVTIQHLVGIEAVVFGVALLLTTLGAVLSVRIALRPLNRMARTAGEVASLPLSSGNVSLPERAPLAASGTEVGTVADAFNHMLEHVEASLKKRQESEVRLRRFIADASHELRTPVAVVRSHAEYAQRTADELPPQVVHSLARIVAESERMGHLVEDLLLLARLDSGRPLARDEVDVSRLLVDAVTDAQVAARDHIWTLDLPEEPVTVLGDDHALHQAVANLLANAAMHTPAGTTVQALLHVPEPRDAVEIVICDDGPGIPDRVREGVFERFVRGDETRSYTAGSSGLGLSIVHAIVHAHGGTVQVASRPGRTRFAIRLPVRSTAEPSGPDAAGSLDPILT
jgi:two-component system, OmpR family, sensor kinase